MDRLVQRQTPQARATPAAWSCNPARPWPLGAHFDGSGVNFAVFSAHAAMVELCLFSADGLTEIARVPLPAQSGDIWHGRLPRPRPA
jgi:isoamylase